MELVLLVCLLSSPSDCREEHVSISVDQTAPMQCMIGAQPLIAQWTATHPKWRVEKWRCGPAGFMGQRI